MEQLQARRFLPRFDGLEGGRVWGGRIVNAGVCDDGEEFVDGTPRDGPGVTAVSECNEVFPGRRVPFAVFPVSVNQQVGVDRNHESVPP